jgi:hypothetical protein
MLVGNWVIGLLGFIEFIWLLELAELLSAAVLQSCGVTVLQNVAENSV